MKTILTTGAGGTASANFVDSLRLEQEQFKIVGTDVDRYHIELNNVDSRYLVPPCSKPEYIDRLNYVIEKEGVEFVHPQPDVEVLALASNQKRIRAKLSLPNKFSIEICQDKFDCYQHLDDKGIPVAHSIRLWNREQTKEAITNLLRWNDKVWLRAIRGAGSKAAVPIYHADEAHGWINIWRHRNMEFPDFMVSEYLPGKDYAFTSLWKNGELITSTVRQREMYLLGFTSPSGQSSTPSVAVTVHNAKVNEMATNAILAVDAKPNGAYYVDLKENSKEIPCVTEINAGRFNATINYYAHAGLNLPYLHVKAAFDEELPTLPKFDALPKGLYWVRQIDMGFKLLKENEFRSLTA